MTLDRRAQTSIQVASLLVGAWLGGKLYQSLVPGFGNEDGLFAAAAIILLVGPIWWTARSRTS